jgi:hypothetical protein
MRRYTGSIVFVSLALFNPPAALAAPDGGPAVQAMPHQEASVLSTPVSDEAAMVVAGTALLGLAAAVRRAA